MLLKQAFQHPAIRIGCCIANCSKVQPNSTPAIIQRPRSNHSSNHGPHLSASPLQISQLHTLCRRPAVLSTVRKAVGQAVWQPSQTFQLQRAGLARGGSAIAVATPLFVSLPQRLVRMQCFAMQPRQYQPQQHVNCAEHRKNVSREMKEPEHKPSFPQLLALPLWSMLTSMELSSSGLQLSRHNCELEGSEALSWGATHRRGRRG